MFDDCVTAVQFYDRRSDEATLDEVERVGI
jgi:hypothetical protein